MELNDSYTQDDIEKAKQVIKQCDRLELDVDEPERPVEHFGNLQIRFDNFIEHSLDGDLAKLYSNGFAISMISGDSLFINPIKGEETSAPIPEPLQHVDGEVTMKEPGKYVVKTS